jgi:acetyl esterase/lipase
MKFSTVIALAVALTPPALIAAENSDIKNPRRAKVRAAILKKYDANGNNTLDEDERAEILKKYDTNGDKKLDQAERAALVKALRGTGDNTAKPARAPAGGEKRIYKKIGDIELPLYIYKPENHPGDAKAPAIVFFFGGGWRSGSPSQFQEHCKHLAQRGMVAVTVEYRVSSRHQAKIEDCIEDAKSAMRWVRGNAADLGVDPKRIASGGGSAGGHLAACVSVIDDFDAKSDDTKVSPRPDAMVLFNPAIAIAEHEKLPDAYNERMRNASKSRARGPAEKVSPLNHATKKQPPCIMFFGSEDALKAGGDVYVEVSKKAGNECRMVSYEGQGHGFFNYGRSGNKYYKLTLEEMDKFLVKLGWIKDK